MSKEVDWAAEVEQHEKSQNVGGSSGGGSTSVKEKITRAPLKDENIPEIPELFDPETYDPPPSFQKHKDGMVTKYSWNFMCDPHADEGDEDPPQVLQQVIETWKVETSRVKKSVADRRKITKYGMAMVDDKRLSEGKTDLVAIGEETPIVFMKGYGPRVGTVTTDSAGEKVYLDPHEEDELKKLRQTITSQLQFHNLLGDRVGRMSMVHVNRSTTDAPTPAGQGGTSFSDRVKKSRESGGGPGGESSSDMVRPGRPGGSGRRELDTGSGVRVTNLSENITERDIQDLFGTCGKIQRVFLARDKRTGKAKGFAYVTYDRKEDAERAINCLNKHPYDHLILSVEWSKSDKDRT